MARIATIYLFVAIFRRIAGSESIFLMTVSMNVGNSRHILKLFA